MDVFNSLVRGNGSTGVTSSAIGCTVVGNGLGASAHFGVPSYSGAGSGVGSIIRDNLGLQTNGGPYSCLPTGTPLSAFSVGSTTSDPLFINSDIGDYRLAPNSPCRDAVISIANPFPTDLNGSPRVWGPYADMGCFEMGPPLMAGTGDALAVYGWINQQGDSLAQPLVCVPGDLATFLFASPGGSLAGHMPLLAVELYPDWNPPIALVLPGVWLDAGATIVYGGFPSGLFFFGLPPEGFSGAWSVPPGLSGWRLRMQGFVTTTAANNGLFAATNAIELDF